ncbi:MAG: ATP-binding protein [Verrucomicrobiota bacterium]
MKPTLSPEPESPGTSAPTVAEVEATPLRRLVHHRESIAHDTRLEDVHRFFNERQTDFAALVRDGRVTGICGRAQLGFLLGSRFGFALNARSPAHVAGVKRPLVFPEDTPLREVLQAALGRHDDEFYEDVALVDHDLRLIGLIPVEALVRLQSRLVHAQLAEMRRQHETLQRQNLELFQAGHAVRQAQALSAGLFASSAVGVALVSAAGRLQACNRRFGELLGLEPNLPEDLTLEALLPEPDRAAWRELLLDLERNAAPSLARDFDLAVPGRGPRTMHFSLGWIAETSQACVCVDDITQQREFERRLQREEKQKLLDTLAGGVAHELNNKLTPVLGYAELIAQEATPSQVEFVGYIRKGVQESAHIIRQLLRLSKPEGGAMEPVDLRDVITEAALMLRFEAREARARIRVETGDEPLTVSGDASLLKQVVMNLALNALHAMEETVAPELRLTGGRDAAGVFFTVQDNGCGIPPEIVGRIFDPFFTTKGPDKGTGLGLSICHSIARQHGGRIEVRSKPDEGACFTVWLPVLSRSGRTERGSPQPPFAGEVRCPAGRRVLVVDDEPVIRNFLMEAMRSLYGCIVDGAADGREGLDQAALHDYDLILSDIRMPGMTGPEFYLRLRDSCPAQAARMIFVTGHMGQGQLQEDIARWGVPVLAKPFTMDRLARVCAPHLAPVAAGAA